MKRLVIAVMLLLCVPAYGQSLTQQIAVKQAELQALQLQQAQNNAPFIYSAMTEMVKASSNCVAQGLGNKKFYTRTAAVSKACREQAQLGAFAICATTVAQTGDTRDLNQCVAMMQNDGMWEQVWMRGLSIGGTILGVREAGSILEGVVVPLAKDAINKNPPAPVLVDPLIVRPEVIEPTVIEPTVIPLEPVIVQ